MKFLLPVACGLLLIACHSAADQASEQKEMAAIQPPSNAKASQVPAYETNPLDALSSAAAQPLFEDSLHRFVRTANLRFRTQEVVKTSLAVEDLFTERNGYIEHSQIASQEQEVSTAPIDAHSEWKITRYTTISTITARIPVAKLDDVLKALQPYVAYLDHRTVDARNIAFDSYLKKLVQQRISAHAERFLKAKSPDEKQGLDQLLEREMQADREKVEDLKLDDQVAYSTVTLSIYGQDKVSREKVMILSTEGYEPGIGAQLLDRLADGWNLIVQLILALVSIWPVLIILGLVWFFWKRRKAGM